MVGEGGEVAGFAFVRGHWRLIVVVVIVGIVGIVVVVGVGRGARENLRVPDGVEDVGVGVAADRGGFGKEAGVELGDVG